MNKINIDKNKINEATELIKLAINDYDSFLKKIDSFPPEKKAEAISWLRNALRYVDKKKQTNNKK